MAEEVKAEPRGAQVPLGDVWMRRALSALLARGLVGKGDLVELVQPWLVTNLQLTMGRCLECGEVGPVAAGIAETWVDQLSSPEGEIAALAEAEERSLGRVAWPVLRRLVQQGEVAPGRVLAAMIGAIDGDEVLPEESMLLVETLFGQREGEALATWLDAEGGRVA